MMMNEEKFNKKAKDIIQIARIFAIGSWDPIAKTYPELIQVIPEDKHSKWDFFMIVAMVWWAVSMLKLEKKNESDGLCNIVESELTKWHPQGLGAFVDLNKFMTIYKKHYDTLTTPKEILDVSKLLCGTWITWNLTNKTKIKNEAEVSSALGHFVYGAVEGYWDEGKDGQQLQTPIVR